MVGFKGWLYVISYDLLFDGWLATIKQSNNPTI